MVPTDPLWLVSSVVLIGAVLFGGVAYWRVGCRGQSAKTQDHVDPSRRILLGRGSAEEKAEPAIPNVTEWKTAREAVEAFADPELRQAREHWSLKYATASEKEAELQQQIKDIKDSFPDGGIPKESSVWPALEQAEKRQRVNAMVKINSKEEVRQLSLDIHSDVHKKLCMGTLVAKGFREPRGEGHSEVRIAPEEWRVLMLRHLDAKAVQKGIEGKLVYSGIVIGKPAGAG